MIKFTARGPVDEIRALFNLLNEAQAVQGVTTGNLQKSKDIRQGLQSFELLITPAPHYEPRQYRERDLSGYVYLLQTGEEGIYKIGKTKDPQDRRKTFGVLLPFNVEYVHLIESDNMSRDERRLHQRFALKRIGRSEFFELSERDVGLYRVALNKQSDTTMFVSDCPLFSLSPSSQPSNRPLTSDTIAYTRIVSDENRGK